MDILAWMVVGIVAGFVAKIVVSGEWPGGMIGNLVIGAMGALIGGWIMHAMGGPGASGVSFGNLAVAFIGAAVLLGGVRTFAGNPVLN